MIRIEKTIFWISEMKRIQLFHEGLDRVLQALGYWGTGAGNSINQSYHISHRRYPGPLVLVKRNAGSGYEIVLMPAAILTWQIPVVFGLLCTACFGELRQ